MSTLIIAEAGVNHNGSIQRAKELIDAAAEAGADIVKFQTFKADRIALPQAPQASYQAINTGHEEGQLDMLKRLELSVEDHLTLMDYCMRKGVKFWSTAFDLDSIDLLHSLGMDMWKIPSGEVTNYPFLKHIAAFNQPVVMSTGMCEMREIEEAIHVLTQNGLSHGNITLLHCNTQYPTPFTDVNLRSMVEMGLKLSLPVGYSDHTLGIEVPIAAVALGAKVIEKHFTLSRYLPGPDHKASLEPQELSQMVKSIRNIEAALGQPEKTVTQSELPNRIVARKSIVAATDINKGDLLTETNLTTKRPGTGLSPMLWPEILGTKAIKTFKKDDFITV